MTRPKKETVDYFPHYVDHGKTMFIIEQKYGNDGYSFWFRLLEMLGKAKGHYLDLKDGATWEFLQAKTHLSDSFCDEILNLLAKLDAIDPELWSVKVVWSQNYVDGLATVYRNRGTKTPSRPSFYIQKPHNGDVSTPENPQSRVEGVEGVEEKRENCPTPCGANLPESTENERAILHELKQVPGYPLDYEKDLALIRELATDFPVVDLLVEAKKWRTYKIDKPLTKKSNPRLQLRNWCEIATGKIGQAPRAPTKAQASIQRYLEGSQ